MKKLKLSTNPRLEKQNKKLLQQHVVGGNIIGKWDKH
jgi:hypothetical protein